MNSVYRNDGHTHDAERINPKESTDIESDEEFLFVSFDPLERKHQYETGVYEEQQYAELAEIIREARVGRDE
jgi:hypothetical protein